MIWHSLERVYSLICCLSITLFICLQKKKKNCLPSPGKNRKLSPVCFLCSECVHKPAIFLRIFHSLCLHNHSLSKLFLLPFGPVETPGSVRPRGAGAPSRASAGCSVSAFHCPWRLPTLWAFLTLGCLPNYYGWHCRALFIGRAQHFFFFFLRR